MVFDNCFILCFKKLFYTAPRNELDKISKSPDFKTYLLPKCLKMQKIGHFAQVRLCITDYMCMITTNGILYCVSLILHKCTLLMM